MAHRWGLLDSAHRPPQAQRTVATQGRRPRDRAVQAFQRLGRTAGAGAAEAHQALAPCAHDGPATCLHDRPRCPTPPEGQRGRPSPRAPPAQSVSPIGGALASRGAARQARVDQPSAFRLATHALDEAPWPAPEGLAGYTGPASAARGFRVRTAPQCLASSRSRKNPARLMALWMVLTGCVLVSAAVESRIRRALHEHGATLPDHKGKRLQPPTARGVLHSCVGMHGLDIPGQGRIMLTLTDAHQHLLQLLGKREAWFDR